MNFSRVLSIFLGCFVYCCLTSSNGPSEETRNLNKQLRRTSHKFQSGYLCMALAAASSGRNFVKLSEPVTKDCVKTAKTIMEFFVAPSTYQTSLSIIQSSVNKTIAKLERNTVGSLVELVCTFLDQEASLIEYQNFNLKFKDNKRSFGAEPLNSTNDYITQIPPGKTVDQFLKSGDMIFLGDVVELIKFGTIREFHSYRDQKSNVQLREYMAAATAVHQLSQYTDLRLRDHVDELFKYAFQDFYNYEVYNQTNGDYNRTNAGQYAIHFTRKLDTHFASYPPLDANVEYLRLKREALQRVPNDTRHAAK